MKLGPICDTCPYRDRPGPIKPDGSVADALIVVVGEAPGKEEIELGKGFVGPAGRELWKLAGAAGLTRSECYVTNVVKCLPHGAEQKDYRLDPGAVEHCKQHLKEELQKCQTNVVVPLGGLALQILTGMQGIQRYRGAILRHSLRP